DAEVSVASDSATFGMQSLAAGDPLVVRLSFAPGVFSATPAVWQTQQAAQNSRAWVWFVVAALVLVGGVTAFYRAARPYMRTIPKANAPIYKPPADLPPALAGYLSNQTIGWHHALAT